MKPQDKAMGVGGRPHAKARSRSRPCPVCGQRAREAYRPFCSRRCADDDLGRWLGGRYAIPGPAAEADESPQD